MERGAHSATLPKETTAGKESQFKSIAPVNQPHFNGRSHIQEHMSTQTEPDRCSEGGAQACFRPTWLLHG